MMDLYRQCNFMWKWRNLAYYLTDPKAHEFDSDERNFHIEDGCGEGMITKVETEWEVQRDKVTLTGDCVKAPAPCQLITTTVTIPTSNAPALQITTERNPESTTSIFQNSTNPTSSLTNSTDQSRSASKTAFTDQSAGTTSSKVVSETATKYTITRSGTTPEATLTSTEINTGSTTSTASTMSPELRTTDAIAQTQSSSSTALSGRFHTTNVPSSEKPNSTSNQLNSNKDTSNHASQAVTATETTEATTLSVTITRASRTEQGKIQRGTRPSNSSLSGSGVLLLYKHRLSIEKSIYRS